MKKRVLSSIIMVIMLVSSFAVFCIPANAAAMGFTVDPVVLIGGGKEYNIVWENDTIGIGYVTYKYDGKTYTVYDEENGVVRSDDKTHTVRVPMEHLDKAGSYTVNAASVTSRDGYTIVTGSVATKSNVFKGYTGQKKITMGFISDSHLLYASRDKKKYDAMMASYPQVVEEFMKRPDIMVLNGDITNELIKEEEYYALFELIRLAGSDGTYPVLYIVGNHEKRGFYSKEIEKYLCYDTGEFYTYFEYGPLASYVVDIGEDKEDGQEEYGGLIDMERYFDEQLKYFESHPGYSEESIYKFTMGHGPGYVGNNHHAADQNAFRALFYNYGTDFHVCGHDHELKFRPGNSSVLFHVISDGGHNNNQTLRTTLLTFENGNITFKGMNDDGSQAYTKTISAADNGSPAPKADVEEKQEVAETVTETVEPAVESVPTMAGMSTIAIKGAADTTANVTKPVVFDAGEYYSIVWQTTSGIKCAGYVDVQGISKTFMDQHGGKLRTETTHSVRIPKDAMTSGKNYTIKSRVVTNYNGYGMVESSGKNPTAYGPYATGKSVKFNAQPNGKSTNYSILAVANKTGGAADAQKLTSKYKKAPNLVVMTGDMVANLNTERDFGSLLEYANTLTGGSTPVMLLRGENETKGGFAAYLPRILHNFISAYNINRLYTTYSASRISIIGLDTATTKKDSDASYNGFANFDKLRAEQADWLENKLPKSFAGDYNIVFANATDLKNCVGVDFTKGFEKHKIQLVVSAGTSTQFADGGKYYSQATIGDALGLLITCKDEEITVQSIGDELTDLGTINTADVTYSGQQTSPGIKPDPETPKDDPKDDPSDDPNDEPENKPDDEKEDNKKENEKENNSSKDDGSYVSGELDGPDGSIFEDDVEDGWYYDYLGYNVKITDSDISLSGDVTEGKFIYVTARYAGVANATSEQNAAQWAQDVGLFNGTLGDNTISEDTANSIVKSIFAI